VTRTAQYAVLSADVRLGVYEASCQVGLVKASTDDVLRRST
jgi:hypothetical protein